MPVSRRSTYIVAPLLAATSLAILAGCRRPEMERCVDEANRVVPDSFCNTPQQRSPSGVPLYRFYYGGGGGFSPGTVVTGGTFSPVPGRSYASGTTRGGFGSTLGGDGAHGSSSGEGGGGGE